MIKNPSDSQLPRVKEFAQKQYIQERLGPQQLPFALPVTLVYAAIFITGVVGNLAICRVIAKNASMQTSTNYYLFSLAVSDLSLLILGLPNEVSMYWQQYPWAFGTPLCKLRALVSEMASYTSVLTIVAFSMERYLAICHPMLNHGMTGLHRAIKVICALWIVSLLAATPFALFTKINYLQYPEGSGNELAVTAFCAMLKENIPKGFPIYELSFLLFFLVPLKIIVILYILIGRKIQSSGNELAANADSSVHRDARHLKSRRNIIRMLIAVVVTFFICWCPFHAQRLFYVYGQDLKFYKQLNEWIFDFSGVLYYLSATMNPILYNLMSVKYRAAFRQTLACATRRRGANRRRTMRETVTIRTSSLRESVVRVRNGCSTELYPITCEMNDVEKNSYTALPTTELPIAASPEIPRRHLRIKNKSLSCSSDDYRLIRSSNDPPFERDNTSSL
ncbi:hypothetical protein GE061_000503 [Apolygus lucorum]|uniref:G-protein coupled receptors family 1 profile domain-containing protein n=1 Tax=Apolygus lucorum TaxID=248454 RepID=A0A6A4KBG8_APOLU|nr:hypothetical protein GE061_000503 [Apolygus lucorum]